MSSDLLAAHLASVKEFICSSSGSSSEKKKSKNKPIKALPKTPKGLPQPNIKVGKKRLLTSYVGSTQEALKKSEKHLSKVIDALPSQMEKKKKARGDTIRIIKLQHSKRK